MGVIQYVMRRLIGGFIVVLCVGLLTFGLAFLVPVDPARAIGGSKASAETLAAIRQNLGLEEPFLVQLGAYLARLVRGDLGHSYVQHEDVLVLLLDAFPATIQLAVAGVIVELLVGLPIGVAAAIHRGEWIDRVATGVAVVLIGIPSFLIGQLLLRYLALWPAVALRLSILPVGGYHPLDLRTLFLPALTLGFSGAAYYARLTRTRMSDELRADYIRTARAKGVSERRVHWRHALRNTFGPVLAQIGVDFGAFMGGVVVVETIFIWPGIGLLAFQAFGNRDVPLIMGTVLFGTVFVVLANLVVDVLAAMLDPRLAWE
jgi:peptide/nickel transport system permease protein